MKRIKKKYVLKNWVQELLVIIVFMAIIIPPILYQINQVDKEKQEIQERHCK